MITYTDFARYMEKDQYKAVSSRGQYFPKMDNIQE
jgi:hypothetical protein